MIANVENPDRQLEYLEQCFSSDKRPLGVFLGAGCPMAVQNSETNSPLIADIAGITQIVRDTLEKDPQIAPLFKEIDDHFSEDGRSDKNIEKILGHIRALRLVAGKAKVRDLSAEDLDNLDQKICDVIHKIVDQELPAEFGPYHKVASWVDGIGRDLPVDIFTTNYDLLMEQAFEDLRVPYFDGFAGSRRPFFDIRAMEEEEFPPRWAHLWKLHGSINWYQVDGKGVIRGTTREPGLKRVIHPSHLKYEESRRMPYLAMLDRLRAFLRHPTAVLAVCGYSFGDDHINEVIVQALQATPGAVVFAFLFGELKRYPGAIKLAKERSNLTVLARDGGVVGGYQVKWPEREEEAQFEVKSLWIDWKKVDLGSGKNKFVMELKFGNFNIFGEFFYKLIGIARKLKEAKIAQAGKEEV